MSFRDLNLSPALCRTLDGCGYSVPTPVQEQAIPVVLSGSDLLAAAQTGTGKTAAFALPILHRLETHREQRPRGGRPRALVLTPTRELAVQVSESFSRYGRGGSARSLAVYGGAGMVPQTQSLRRGVEIVVATPGRLLDHLGQGNLTLSGIEVLVLDEADRMLDMGFLPDLERILAALPADRQSLLFSATFPKEIRDLATRLLHDPVEVQAEAPNSPPPLVSHSLHLVEREAKRDLLVDLLATGPDRQALVFCRTRHGSDRLCHHLVQAGFAATAIHGDKSQTARTRALAAFKTGRTSILVATDVAARGLDIRQLPLVVNYDLPHVPEDYIHRIGRTGRAGDTGRAVSLVSRAERSLLHGIERLLNHKIEVVHAPAGTMTLPNGTSVDARMEYRPSEPERPSPRPRQDGRRPESGRSGPSRHAGQNGRSTARGASKPNPNPAPRRDRGAEPRRAAANSRRAAGPVSDGGQAERPFWWPFAAKRRGESVVARRPRKERRHPSTRREAQPTRPADFSEQP